MSLATRCTSCRTVFRVVQDQLKVSEGWVRCGRCSEVFNALPALFDLEREAPADTAAGETPTALATDMPAPPDASRIDPEPERALDEPLDDPATEYPARARRPESVRKSVGQVGARDRLEFSDARFDSELLSEAPPEDSAAVEAVAATPGDLELEQSKLPEFMRRAQRRSRWRSVPSGPRWAVLTVLAGLAFAAQSTHQSRAALAERWPETRPTLSQWCEVAGCTIEPLREIENVLIEATALTQDAEPDALRLGVTLRNQSRRTLGVPSVDLGLTDADGRLIARRVLSPADFGSATTLPAGSERALQLSLRAKNSRVSGYTVEIFYP